MDLQNEINTLKNMYRGEIEENIRQRQEFHDLMEDKEERIIILEAALKEEQTKNAILVAEKDKLMDELEAERNTIIFEATGEYSSVSSSKDEDNDDDELSYEEYHEETFSGEYNKPMLKNGRWYLSCGCNRNYASKAAAVVCHSGKVYKSRPSGPVPCDFSNSMDI